MATSTKGHTDTPMTRLDRDRSEFRAKQDQGDVLRRIAEAVQHLIPAAAVDGLTGARQHEGSGDRTTWQIGNPGNCTSLTDATVETVPDAPSVRPSAGKGCLSVSLHAQPESRQEHKIDGSRP